MQSDDEISWIKKNNISWANQSKRGASIEMYTALQASAERLLEVKSVLKSDMHATERNSETMTRPAEETLTKQYGPLLSIINSQLS